MADAPNRPQPPEGFQRPGIPGAGNLLDPAVRGELREKLQEAAHGARDQVQQAQPAPASAPEAEQDSAARETVTPPTESPRKTPFAHGDVDLTGLAANVTPAKPRRTRGQRRFYFLPETMTAKDDEPTPPAPGPKPG